MEVNLVQINSQGNLSNLPLNISITSKTGLNFKQGEVLKGQVIEIKENGLISINIKGKIIEALSTVEVNKGQQLFLMVDNIKDGKAILKVVTPDMLNKMENANLSNTLKEMNLPSHDKNLQMAEKLIQHKLPLTAENIKIISKGLSLLNGVSPKNLELVGMAMAKGVPITKQALESLAQFVEGKSHIAGLTKETSNLLNQMASNPTTPKSSTDVTRLLNELVETIKLPVEKSPASDLANEISQALKSNLANENDLVRGLSLAKDILGQKEMPGISKELINLLFEQTDDMGKELAGQRILNVISKFSEDSNANFYYLSFPIKMDDQYRLSQLKISKDPGKKYLADMDPIKFVASLDTSKLGFVLFHVEWHKNSSLNIEGVVENQTALKHIEANVNRLIKDLQSHNYVVNYNGIKVSANGKEEMSIKLEEKTELVKPFEVDVWV